MDVNVLPSARFEESSDQWAACLRQRAFEAPPRVDDAAILAWFRRCHPHYERALAGVTRLQDAPVLDKADVASVPPLVAPDGQVVASTSSGTSGLLVTVHNSPEERRFRRALMYRPFTLYDLPSEVRQLSFVDFIEHAGPAPNGEFLGRRYVRWQTLAHASVDVQFALLEHVRPQVLTGFASAMVRLAEAYGPRLAGRDLRMLSPGGELIPEAWRRILEESYRVPVNDRYGATETGAIAWQCPQCRRYHANVDEMSIEADPDGCIITPWFLTTQPLLRYRLGDALAWEDGVGVSCSVRLPILRIEQARRDDWLVDGSGGNVSPLTFHFERFEGLAAWRVHQDASGQVTAFVSLRRALTPSVEAEILADLRAVVTGRPVSVVEGTWRSPRVGKFKRVSSELPGAQSARRETPHNKHAGPQTNSNPTQAPAHPPSKPIGSSSPVR